LVVDSATKTAATNDYTVLQVWGETSTGFYLLHNWRGRVEYVALRTKVMEFFDQWRPRWVLIEDAGSGASLIQDLDATTSLPLKKLRPDRSKIARAESITPLIESGRVYLPQTAPWLNDFLDELHAFPRGVHDDQTDCVVYALQFFRNGQGIFKGWHWELVARHTELVKQHPGMSREELASKCGFAPEGPPRASAGDAQMDAQEGTVKFKRNKRVFGDLETNRMSSGRERVPRSAQGPPACPGCGNAALARYSDWQCCARCGWDSRNEIAPPLVTEHLTPPVSPKSAGLLDFVFGRMSQ
jgi:predicted phage terminase large subunit-like protein